VSTGTGTMIQTPVVGNALRDRLGLDAAGRMPLTMSDEVMAVAIVADVRDLIDSSPVDCFNYVSAPQVAARWTRCALQFQANIVPKASRIIIDAVTLFSGTTQLIYCGLINPPIGLNTQALPQRKISSVARTQTNARAVYDDTGASPTVGDYAFVIGLTGNAPQRIIFEHPIILDRPDDVFVLACLTVNTTLVASFEWREEIRQ